ncbi:MAG: hypothetical protein ACKOD4_03110, partial [Candidatus Limnocylindrus sp.]
IVAYTLLHAGRFTDHYLSKKRLKLHIVLTNSDRQYCERVARSLEDQNLSWMWDPRREDGCNSTGGGQGIGTDKENVTSAWWYDSWNSIGPDQRTGFQALFGTEVAHAIQNNIGQRYGATASFLSLQQAWLGYTWPWINGFSYTVNSWGSKQAERYWKRWGVYPDRATWNPSFSDQRWCPQPGTPFAATCGEYLINQAGGLNDEYPSNYHLIAQMVPFLIAHFGPNWIQEAFWPTFIDEYGGVLGHFYKTYDRIALRLWNGDWEELEGALDLYVLQQFKEIGITGLE